MRKAAKMGTKPEGNQSRARRMRARTGVALIAVRRGARKAPKRGFRPAASPAAPPARAERAKAARPRRKVAPRASRKAEVG